MTEELQLLMLQYDLEADADERARVALLLLRDWRLRSQLEDWRLAGALIRELAADAPAPVGEAMVVAIMARVDRSRWSLARARWAHWRRGVGVACVAAAAILLVTDRSSNGPQPLYGAELASPPQRTATQITARANSLSESPSTVGPIAIERVDFGRQSGAIFVVSSGDTETPVVWLSDDQEGGRMVQL